MRPTRFLPFAVAALLAACGGAPPNVRIPLNDARALNSEIAAAYVQTQELMEKSTGDVDTIGLLPEGITARSFDVPLARQVMEACMTEALTQVPGVDPHEVPRAAKATEGPELAPLSKREAVGRIRPCKPARTTAMESYLEAVKPEVREFLVGRVLLVDEVRVNLKDVLVAQIDALEKKRAEAQAESARLREQSEEKRVLARSPEISAEKRRQTEIDYEAIIRELDQIDSTLEEIKTRIGEFRQLRRQLVELASQRIAALGTP